MKLETGEVVLVRMWFHQAQGSKVRPAVVLADTGDLDFVGAPVTSQSRKASFDLPIREWREAGLNIPSTVRVHKLTVISKAEVVSRVGYLSVSDRELLMEQSCLLFCPKRPRVEQLLT